MQEFVMWLHAHGLVTYASVIPTSSLVLMFLGTEMVTSLLHSSDADSVGGTKIKIWDIDVQIWVQVYWNPRSFSVLLSLLWQSGNSCGGGTSESLHFHLDFKRIAEEWGKFSAWCGPWAEKQDPPRSRWVHEWLFPRASSSPVLHVPGSSDGPPEPSVDSAAQRNSPGLSLLVPLSFFREIF